MLQSNANSDYLIAGKTKKKDIKRQTAAVGSRSPENSPLRIPDISKRGKRKSKKSMDSRGGPLTALPTAFGIHT